MAEILRKTYLELDHYPAVGNFQSGSDPIHLHLIWLVSFFSLRPSELRNEQSKTHTKRERGEQIMKCSIIETQTTTSKKQCSSILAPFLCVFSSALNRECYQIKVVYHSLLHRITAGTRRLMPIAQLHSVHDMYPQDKDR